MRRAASWRGSGGCSPTQRAHDREPSSAEIASQTRCRREADACSASPSRPCRRPSAPGARTPRRLDQRVTWSAPRASTDLHEIQVAPLNGAPFRRAERSPSTGACAPAHSDSEGRDAHRRGVDRAPARPYRARAAAVSVWSRVCANIGHTRPPTTAPLPDAVYDVLRPPPRPTRSSTARWAPRTGAPRSLSRRTARPSAQARRAHAGHGLRGARERGLGGAYSDSVVHRTASSSFDPLVVHRRRSLRPGGDARALQPRHGLDLGRRRVHHGNVARRPFRARLQGVGHHAVLRPPRAPPRVRRLRLVQRQRHRALRLLLQQLDRPVHRQARHLRLQRICARGCRGRCRRARGPPTYRAPQRRESSSAGGCPRALTIPIDPHHHHTSAAPPLPAASAVPPSASRPSGLLVQPAIRRRVRRGSMQLGTALVATFCAWLAAPRQGASTRRGEVFGQLKANAAVIEDVIAEHAPRCCMC